MTLNEARKAAKGFRDRWNDNIKRYRAGALDDAAFHAAQREADRDRDALKARLLDDPESAAFVCDKTVTFQADKRYGLDGNHTLGHELGATFPDGENDSESGQGFFYVPAARVAAVLAHLSGGRANHVHVGDTYGLTLSKCEPAPALSAG